MEADGSDEIRVVIYGCRGSIPVNGRDFDEFGGSTSCILITSDDSVNVSIIDAGTGIRRLGQEIMKDEILPGETHCHCIHALPLGSYSRTAHF